MKDEEQAVVLVKNAEEIGPVRRADRQLERVREPRRPAKVGEHDLEVRRCDLEIERLEDTRVVDRLTERIDEHGADREGNRVEQCFEDRTEGALVLITPDGALSLLEVARVVSHRARAPRAVHGATCADSLSSPTRTSESNASALWTISVGVASWSFASSGVVSFVARTS